MGGRGGMNPKKLQGMMKQLGIEMEEIEDAEQVIIKSASGDIVIDEPSVTIMRAQGVDTYQITGSVTKLAKELEIPEYDVDLVAEQTGADKEKVREVLKEVNGDLAEAILKLSE